MTRLLTCVVIMAVAAIIVVPVHGTFPAACRAVLESGAGLKQDLVRGLEV